jgi:hypothetical protein
MPRSPLTRWTTVSFDHQSCHNGWCVAVADLCATVKYFLISAPVDWSPDQYIRRFLLPTGEYVSCVLW